MAVERAGRHGGGLFAHDRPAAGLAHRTAQILRFSLLPLTDRRCFPLYRRAARFSEPLNSLAESPGQTRGGNTDKSSFAQCCQTRWLRRSMRISIPVKGSCVISPYRHSTAALQYDRKEYTQTDLNKNRAAVLKQSPVHRCFHVPVNGKCNTIRFISPTGDCREYSVLHRFQNHTRSLLQ